MRHDGDVAARCFVAVFADAIFLNYRHPLGDAVVSQLPYTPPSPCRVYPCPAPFAPLEADLSTSKQYLRPRGERPRSRHLYRLCV